jgi:DNA-damage-inducible protein J
MAKTDAVYMRIDPELKKNSEVILSKLGLTQNEAINVFLSQVVLQRGLPFTVKMPPLSRAEAETRLLEKIREAEESSENEPHMTLTELKERLGV